MTDGDCDCEGLSRSPTSLIVKRPRKALILTVELSWILPASSFRPEGSPEMLGGSRDNLSRTQRSSGRPAACAAHVCHVAQLVSNCAGGAEQDERDD
jgi:hypothetical protein